MNRANALGWKKDEYDPRDKDAVTEFLKPTALASPALAANDVTNDDITQTIDQEQLGSCTVNSSGQAVRAAQLLELVEIARLQWTKAGKDPSSFDASAALLDAQAKLEFWSRLALYFWARAYDHTTRDDAGTNIRTVFKAANKYGFPRESVWPYSDNTDPKQGPTPFSHNPPAYAYSDAYDQRASADNANAQVIDYARITATGQSLIDAIKLACQQRHLVVFGTLVTENFCSDMSANNGSPIDPPKSASGSDIAGGHALAIGGYDSNAKIINSWGTSFGGRAGLPAGWCRFSWDYILWSQTNDFWIVRRAPMFAARAA